MRFGDKAKVKRLCDFAEIHQSGGVLIREKRKKKKKVKILKSNFNDLFLDLFTTLIQLSGS